MNIESSTEITMYSGDHCGDCTRSKRLLDSLGVGYSVIEVDGDVEALANVMKINGGFKSIPVIVFPDGTHLTEPSDLALTKKLKALSLI